jgi:carbamoyl-phosphate synthase small subunit
MKARMLLSNGMIFEGDSIGAENTLFGELVFNTSMVGYQEILTDPSYASQVVIMTYPEIGNYGINDDDFESDNVHARGFIIKNYSEKDSHYQSAKTLSTYLKENNIVGIANIDTRTLTRTIREVGAMYCVVTTEAITDKLRDELKPL